MKNKKFTVIGGDVRNIKLAELLKNDGNDVYMHGFKNSDVEVDVREFDDLKQAVGVSDIIIGPVPCSNDGETINAAYHPDKIYINEVFRAISNKQIFIAGRISDKILHMAQAYNVYTVDILHREEMSVLNAIPTAEGAIQIAMQEMPITVHGSNFLVVGYGRIGKTLSKMLRGIGAHVYCAARKYSDMAWVKSQGYIPLFINDLDSYVSEMDVIINTVPALVLNSSVLARVRKECLIIDLASKPGGIGLGI